MGRADAIQAQPERRDVARLGEIDRDPGQHFGIVGEQLLGGDRLPVTRAARPPGGIAALAFLELHAEFPFVAVTLDGVGVHDTAPETQSARAASRRAQFQLWIFSYTKLVGSSKKRVSRVMIGRSRLDIIGRPVMKSRRSDQARLVSALPLTAAQKRTSGEVRVGPTAGIGAYSVSAVS